MPVPAITATPGSTLRGARTCAHGADADVTFVLTTNRADILETALADRPGRVDLAVEIPRPDARCRERLLRVYARDLAVDADLGQVVAGSLGHVPAR